jgi:hypothetical protein
MPLKLCQQDNRGQVAAELAALFGQSFSRHTGRLDNATRMLIDQDFRLRRLRVTPVDGHGCTGQSRLLQPDSSDYWRFARIYVYWFPILN